MSQHMPPARVATPSEMQGPPHIPRPSQGSPVMCRELVVTTHSRGVRTEGLGLPICVCVCVCVGGGGGGGKEHPTHP
jgi:hypothetical protein